MEQPTQVDTVTDIRLPGVPADASTLLALRDILRQQDIRRLSAQRFKEAENTHKAVNLCTQTPEGSRKSGQKMSLRTTPSTRSSAVTNTQSQFPTTLPKTDITKVPKLTLPPEATNGSSSSTESHCTDGHSVPDLLTKNNTLRRILERVNWAKLHGDTKQEVATFHGFQEAEEKFQDFESFIRAEGRNLGLPEGCKPFERVLIRSGKNGAQPQPYILFTNFRSEADVRKYHAALSKRRVRNQYYPPLRLCYELQQLRYNAASANIHVAGDLGNTLCGKTAIIQSGNTRRLVTVGGIVQVDNKLYAMTAGHSPGAGENHSVSSDADSALDIPFDDSDFDDDLEPALIFGGPGTTSEARYQPTGGQDKVHNQRASTSVVVEFDGSSMEGDDWSLHLIKDPLLLLPNAFPGTDGTASSYMTYPASQPVSSLVWLLAGVSGCRVVQMLPSTVTFPLPSGKWIKAWKVSLAHIPVPHSASNPSTSLQQGDSGSWVVDRVSGTVFGHVIASNDTSAFLIPLKDTLESISQSSKMKGTGDIISLPPAFDNLANLARAHHIGSQEKRETNTGDAMQFASRALMTSTLKQSPASHTAQMIDSVLLLYEDFEIPVKAIFQNLLICVGAKVKVGLASIWHDGKIESLLDSVKDSTPSEREAARRALLDLTVALDISSTTISKSLEDAFGTGGEPTDDRLITVCNTKPRPDKSSNQVVEIESSEKRYMTPALRNAADTQIVVHPRSQENILTETLVPQFSESVKQPRKRASPMNETSRPLQKKQSNALLDRVPVNDSAKRDICGLRRPTSLVINGIIIAVLCIAVGILGGFLGSEVRKNHDLEAQLSKLIDSEPTCSITVTAVTCLSTATPMLTVTSSTASATSTTSHVAVKQGLSSGAVTGIGVGIGVGVPIILICIGLIVIIHIRRNAMRRQQPTLPFRANPEHAGLESQWPKSESCRDHMPTDEASTLFYPEVAEIGPSEHITGSPIQVASLTPTSLQRRPSARIAHVSQIPDADRDPWSSDYFGSNISPAFKKVP